MNDIINLNLLMNLNKARLYLEKMNFLWSMLNIVYFLQNVNMLTIIINISNSALFVKTRTCENNDDRMSYRLYIW